MVDIQPPTTEIRRGKKEGKIEITGQKYNGLPPLHGVARKMSTSRTVICISAVTRMWVNAQRDGRPAEHRWRPLFNAAKFG